MKTTKRLLLVVVALAGLGAAGSEIEQARQRFAALPADDTAAAAGAMLAMLNEAAAKSAALTNDVPRRGWQLLIADIQDALRRFSSPEAQKVLANALPKCAPVAQTAICMGLKKSAANEDVDAAALKLLAPGPNFRLQVAIMDLLAAHKYAPAVDKIIPLLDAKAFPPVQVTACRALGSIPDAKSVPALMKYIEALHAGGGGRYVYEATAALRALTGTKFEANAPELKRWWEKNQKDFVFDPAKAVEPKYNYELTEKANMTYYEIPVVENRLVIVFDISGSMMLGGKPNRLEQARQELKTLVSRMRDKQLFNIVAFSSVARRWKKTPALLPATDANRKDAIAFLDTLRPGGGTMTTTTMEETLEEVAIAFGCESIFLVTDGNPNPWEKDLKAATQERLITWLNQPLKLRINTIGIYTKAASDPPLAAGENIKEMKDFLKDLATHNDGVYKEVGADAGAGK